MAAERRGYLLDDLGARSIKDYVRSCLRGLGEPCRPRPLPFSQLGALPATREAWTSGGPLNPKAAIVVGSWWLCREVELSTLRASMVEFNVVVRPPTASLHLPASKTDQLAAGLARSLSCTCGPSSSSRSSCTVHVLVDHVFSLGGRFLSDAQTTNSKFPFPLFRVLPAGWSKRDLWPTQFARRGACLVSLPLLLTAPSASRAIPCASLARKVWSYADGTCWLFSYMGGGART